MSTELTTYLFNWKKKIKYTVISNLYSKVHRALIHMQFASAVLSISVEQVTLDVSLLESFVYDHNRRGS